MKKDIIHIITFSIGCILIISSALKSINIYSFAIETGEYIDLYIPQWLHSWNMLCAICICAIEMLLGLLSLKKETIVVPTIGTFVLLSFFVYLTGINVFFPSVLGSVESCGCFGEFIHFTPIASFIKSAVMWSLYLIPLIAILKEERKHRTYSMKNISNLSLSLTMSFVLPLFSYFGLNRMEHSTYIITYILLFCTWLILNILQWKYYKNNKEETI